MLIVLVSVVRMQKRGDHMQMVHRPKCSPEKRHYRFFAVFSGAVLAGYAVAGSHEWPDPSVAATDGSGHSWDPVLQFHSV